MQDRTNRTNEYIEILTGLGYGDRRRYEREAFSRNLGLIDMAEQDQLRRSTVAIPGVGGVGGAHLITLVRCGIGGFHVADFDCFEAGNVNRQYGAKVPAFGKPKLETMVDEALRINPFVEFQQYPEGISAVNIDEFLEGVDVVVDSLDFFEFDTRRMLFNRARNKGIHVVSAGPIGFSTAMLVFSPHDGMSFDEYFDITDEMSDQDKVVAFLVGLTPRTKYISYMDLGRANRSTGRAPSLGLACQLCAGAAATETLRILLDRNPSKSAPHYSQFDAYLRRYDHGYLRWGNRHPWQRVKRKIMKRLLGGSDPSDKPEPPAIDDSGAGIGMVSREAIDYILGAGVRAPSGDNAQPWKFGADGDTIRVFIDQDADRSFFNVRQMASIVSSGAVIENMVIAATGCGLRAHVTELPDGGEADLRATIKLVPSDEPRDGLLDAVWTRHTNRTMYLKRPLMEAALDLLTESVSGFEGARLHVLRGKPKLGELARVVRTADLLRVSHRGLHEHFHSMVRRSEDEAEEKGDGFPLKNLEAGVAGELFLKLSRPWVVMKALNTVGMGRIFASAAARGLHHCSAAALLTVDGTLPGDFFTGGRALERAWLTMTDLGLDMQPMTAITLFWLRCQLEGEESFEASHRRLLRSLWGDYRALFPDVDFERQGQVMLFRFGHGRPMKVGTRRKPLESFLIDSQ